MQSIPVGKVHWHDWSGPNESCEVIQIAAIKLASSFSLDNAQFLNIYVRPSFNPLLSQYCTDLTGINQTTIESYGLDFCSAINKIKSFKGDCKAFCWGEDNRLLSRNHSYYGFDGDLSLDIINLKYFLGLTTYTILILLR